MARIAHMRNTFLGGEISPRALGRTDLPTYNHSFEELLNWIVHPQGGAARRPGFRYHKKTHNASNVADGSTQARLIPFIFSQSESYVLELTPGYTDGARFIDANTPATVTQVNTGGDIPSYTAAALKELQYAQAGNIIWLTHPDYAPHYIYKDLAAVSLDFIGNAIDGHTIILNGGFVDLDLIASCLPFRDANATSITFSFSGTLTGGSSVTVTASAAYFKSGMVGSVYKVTHLDTGLKYTGSFRITAYTNSTTVTATIIDDVHATSASADWEEAAWSDYRGWPRTVALFEGRIYYGGNESEPDRVWASAVDSYFDLDARGAALGTSGFRTQTAATPFNFTPNGGQVNDIQWISPGKTLPIGSLGREFIIKGPDQTQGVAFDNISMTPETAHGSAYVQAARVANVVNFVQRSKKKIRELVFDFNSDSYVATDIGFLAGHLLAQDVRSINWQEYPNGVLWCNQDDDSICGLTRERQQQIAAWHSHVIGGHSNSGGTADPTVISTCVVPTSAGVDRLWAVIGRYINGSLIYYIEEMQDEFVDGEDLIVQAANCLDSHKYGTSGSATVTWDAAHLKGQTVKVIAADNTAGTTPYYAGEFAVNSSTGNITLNIAAKAVMLGLPYTSRAKTTKMEGGSQIGTAQGAMKRADKLLLRLYNSWGLNFGSNSDNMKPVKFESSVSPPIVELFTGDKYLDYPNGWDRDQQVILETDWPFPCNVNFISVRAQVNEV